MERQLQWKCDYSKKEKIKEKIKKAQYYNLKTLLMYDSPFISEKHLFTFIKDEKVIIYIHAIVMTVYVLSWVHDSICTVVSS